MKLTLVLGFGIGRGDDGRDWRLFAILRKQRHTVKKEIQTVATIKLAEERSRNSHGGRFCPPSKDDHMRADVGGFHNATSELVIFS